MGNPFTSVLRSFWLTSIELLMLLPGLLALTHMTLPSAQGWLWFISLAVAILFGSVSYVAGIRRVWMLVLEALLIATLWWVFLMHQALLGLFCAAITAAVFVMAFRHVRNHDVDTAPGFYVMGILFYVVGNFVTARVPSWRGLSVLMIGGGLAAVTRIVYGLNTLHLRGLETATATENRPPMSRSVLRHNRSTALVVVLLALVLSQLRDLTLAIIWFFEHVLRQIGLLIELLLAPAHGKTGHRFPRKRGIPQASPTETKAAPWAAWINTVFKDLATIVILCVILYLLYRLGRVLWRYAQRMISLLRSWLTDANTTKGYIDETKPLKIRVAWHDSALLRRLRQLSKRRVREVQWIELKTNRERIRYLYRHAVRQAVDHGYDFRSSLTPQETSTGIRSVVATDPVQLKRLTDLYNEARYGEREVTVADIETLRAALGDGDS